MFSIQADFDRAERILSDLARKQLPFAIAMAVNDSGQKVVEAVENHIEETFHRPTRWTKRAFYLRRARKTNLQATIERKSPQRGRHYLEVQAKGGPRPATGFERLLKSRLKYSGIVHTVVPTKRAKKNVYGNWSPGERNQVLSAIKAQRDSRSNSTKASTTRAKSRAGYFVPREGSRLSSGIYKRTAGGKISKIVSFSPNNATYSKRFRFHHVAERVARREFGRAFARRLAHALETAK